MPTISMFYGIIVRMLFMDTKQHHLPHLHVECQGKQAAISIPDGNLLEGELPAKNCAWYKPGSPSTGYFSFARVDYGTVTWPGDIDIAPETLYEHSIPV